jgi:ABC-type glycerol-3-phosphate transport system substrate-binding protein
MKVLGRKSYLLVLVVLLLVSALGVTVQAQDEVTLVLWHAKQDAEGDALLALIDTFQAANPGITIEQVYNPSGTLQDSFLAAAGRARAQT